MAEERILITKCSGECRNLRIIYDDCDYASEGTYCAAYPHGDWERIDPKECDNCKRDKHLIGISRSEAIKRMAAGMFYISWESKGYYYKGKMKYKKKDINFDDLVEESKEEWLHLAEAALNALLSK